MIMCTYVYSIEKNMIHSMPELQGVLIPNLLYYDNYSIIIIIIIGKIFEYVKFPKVRELGSKYTS